jgi:DNA-binding MarR family transcriptional regulator
MVMGPTQESCFALLRQLQVMFQLKHAMVTRVWASEHDLHPASGGLLAELARCGETTVSDLAQRRLVDTSVVSRQVAQLERAELVGRRPAQHDGRVHLISITDEGSAVLERWRAAQADLLKQSLSGWSDAEVLTVADRIGTLSADVRTQLCTPELAR